MGAEQVTIESPKPSESEILEAPRIEQLCDWHLQRIAARPDLWTELYRDPADGRFWELSYPDSGLHGGGPPRLAVVDSVDALQRYTQTNLATRYALVDAALETWGRRHGLYVIMRHRDDEVRSVSVVDDAGTEYQVFLSAPNDAGRLTVTAVRSAGEPLAATRECDLPDLPVALEDIYGLVISWIRRAGHSRTSVR
jgi:hypothetical protein